MVRPHGQTRRRLLGLLKAHGPRDSRFLSRQMGVSAMAIRQHLYDLRDDRLVTFREEARPLGRPAKLWQLTPAADRFFPDAHATLAVGLIDAMGRAFGPAGMNRLISERVKDQIAEYRKKVPVRAPLKRRLEALAKIRSLEGYMAEVRAEKDGSYLLIENHCPICVAARACQRLCGGELEVFQRVLGADVELERTEHIMAGARRCAYRVKPRK